MSTSLSSELLETLREHASRVDLENDWPAESLAALASAGVLGWVIPTEFGGSPVNSAELQLGYEELATACLSTTFILTQRNGACQRIAGCDNEALKSELLPRLATGETFATVGISHLTTSRQHLAKPSVQVELTEGEIQLNGFIPWVTGATYADHIVTGGTCADGRQVLVALPTKVTGVNVAPPAQLMSLTASYTTSVKLTEVKIPRGMLIAGPVKDVMSSGSGGGAGSLATSVLALGLCRRALDLVGDETSRRTELKDRHQELSREFEALQSVVHRAIHDPTSIDASAGTIALRQRANSLALRLTQAALAMTKGAGFVKGHPAELAVREAMFFLVWSCPQPVLDGNLQEFSRCWGVFSIE